MEFGRRGAMGAVLATGALLKAGMNWVVSSARAADAPAGPATLPDLPWEASALDPVISAKTISFHYGKHHRTYVETVNKLVVGTPFADMPLLEIVQKSAGDSDRTLFNNAAQAWNHDFYWNSLAPKSGGQPGAQILAMINDGFGSFANFKEEYVKSATGQFGSGWVWLSQEKASKKLVLLKTANADTPITGTTHTPLAVLDVWEHAYYLDYQNRRKDHAGEVLDRLLNWRFVEKNLESA